MANNQYNSIDQFVSKQKELLKLEQNEEVLERQKMYENQPVKELIKKGVCVNRLQVDHQRTGLFGKHVIVFSLHRNNQQGDNEQLKSHRLTSGDIVGLYPNKGGNSEILGSGIITRSRQSTISVAFNDMIELSSSSLFRLMKLTNDVTYRRLNRAIEQISKLNIETSSFLKSLFPCQLVKERGINTTINIEKFFNAGLDDSQKEAVRFSVGTSLPIGVIHGPPGTGKTTTVVEIIRQEVKVLYKKVLVCAPSNIAVDNIVERLAKADLKIVRLGHPARIIEDVQKYSLDAILESQDSSGIIKDVKSELTTLCSSKGGSRQKWDEVKKLKKELISREDRAIKSVLSSADVVLSTTTSASNEGPLKHLPADHFSLLIIDEAAQAMEISCWIPLLKVKRCILAGDHLQLPPTIISKKAAKQGLETTMLERVVHGLGENAVQMLTVQYRMNKMIMQWPSQELYHNKLEASDMVANHRLCDLEDIIQSENTTSPFVFVDTAGCNMHELEGGEEESKGNKWEVEIIHKQIEELINDGVPMKHVGVITPYNLQVEMLRQSILSKYPQIEINSVDGFQGREKEAILISLVRSNEDGEIGFLKEDRRINVAITRARRHLFIVGDSVTISRHPFLESLCSFMFENALLKSPLYEQEAVTESMPSDAHHNLSKFELPIQEPSKATSIKSGRTKERINELAQKDVVVKQMETKNGTKTVNKTGLEDEATDSLVTSKYEENLENQINEFVKSTESILEFPSDLSAKQRHFIHEKAEILSLNHASKGEGVNRKIVISKMKLLVPIKSVEESNKETKAPTDDSTSTTTVCSNCLASIPKSNFQLHQLRCSKSVSMKTISTEISGNTVHTQQSSGGAKKKKPKKKKNNAVASKSANEKEEEDDDALLEKFAQMNSRCGFQQCKTSIKLLGQKCPFCSQMFCISHRMEEIHGCGHAVKVKARQDIAKYADAKPRPMNGIKKVQVQKKLDKKVGELQEERKRKSKKK